MTNLSSRGPDDGGEPGLYAAGLGCGVDGYRAQEGTLLRRLHLLGPHRRTSGGGGCDLISSHVIPDKPRQRHRSGIHA
ncbi:hypothetical protein [Bosea beijingensis]|jgi:hypothetical protein